MKILNKGISVLLVMLLLVGFVPVSITNANADGVVLQQKDPKWANYSYGQSTLGPSSCGLFANLNAVQYLTGHTFSIDEIHTWADYAGANYYLYGSGSYHTITSGLAKKYGSTYNYRFTEYYEFVNHVPLNGSKYPTTQSGWDTLWSKLTSELSTGKVCVTLVQGHFIALVDYNPKTGKVLVYDSAAEDSRGTTTSGDWKSSNELYYGSSEGKEKLKVKCCFTFLESTAPVKKTGIESSEVGDITNSNAAINIHLNNDNAENITEYGFYIGQLPSNLIKVPVSVSSSETSLNVNLDISEHYRPLSPGKTYYFYTYAVIGGQTYKTELSQFTTSGISVCSIEDATADAVTSASAKLSAWCINPEGNKISEYGCYFGADSSKMSLISTDTDVENTNLHIVIDLRTAYGSLKSDTKYFYQIYVVVNGETYMSNLYSFTTASSGTEVYYITYDANGGTGAPDEQTKSYDADIYLSNDIPIRSGYKFLGWSTSETASSPEYKPGEIFTDNQSVTLYAVWQKKSVTTDTESDTEFYTDSDFDSDSDSESDTDSDTPKKGDINADGQVDMSDVVSAQKIIAKLRNYSDYGKYAKQCADVNSDGAVNMQDVTSMQKYIAKLIKSFD